MRLCCRVEVRGQDVMTRGEAGDLLFMSRNICKRILLRQKGRRWKVRFKKKKLKCQHLEKKSACVKLLSALHNVQNYLSKKGSIFVENCKTVQGTNNYVLLCDGCLTQAWSGEVPVS